MDQYAESPSFSLFEKHAGFAIIFDEYKENIKTKIVYFFMCKIIHKQMIMVEAAGIEPASVNPSA